MKLLLLLSTSVEQHTLIFPAEQINIILPLYSSVSAGFPSPADDHLEEQLDLNKYLVKNPSSTFFIRVSGQSMINVGIYDGDILVVDRSLEASNGEIIVAVLAGEFTVKRLVQHQNSWYLKAENPKYKPIPLGENDDFRVWGVVTNVLHKPSRR